MWARALAWQGGFVLNISLGLKILGESLSLIEQLERDGQDMRRDKGFLLAILSGRYYSVDRQLARQMADQSLSLYRACNDERAVAGCLANLAQLGAT